MCELEVIMKLWSKHDPRWAANERGHPLSLYGLFFQQHWWSSALIQEVNQQKTYPTPETVKRHLPSQLPETACFRVIHVPALTDRRGTKQVGVTVYVLITPNSLLQPASSNTRTQVGPKVTFAVLNQSQQPTAQYISRHPPLHVSQVRKPNNVLEPLFCQLCWAGSDISRAA